MLIDCKEPAVKSLYSRKPLLLSPENTVNDAVALMFTANMGEIFIVDRKNKLLGRISPESLARQLSKNSQKDIRLCQIMDKTVCPVDENAPLNLCKRLLTESKSSVLPVLRKGVVVGSIGHEHIKDHDYAMLDVVEQQLESILNHIYEGVCTIDLASRVTFWNAGAERIYGVTASEITGQPLGDFFPDAILLKVLKTGQRYENIKHIPRDDSEVVISASPLFFQGNMIGAISSERDISDVRNLSIKLNQARSAVQFLEQEVYKKTLHSESHIIGASQCFSNVLKKVRQASASDANILLIGESGSGKEVIARLIHSKSDRKGLFVPVNCSAIPPDLFESEFFGYEYGAFTGASKQGKAGYFELAQGGTLFLDEVAELPPGAQAKLLRTVEDREVRRIGSEKVTKIDVRMISATHRNLRDMVEKGEFREDLYYRLDVIRLRIPPLRDRGNDILLFIERFLDEIGRKNKKPGIRMSQDALDALLAYTWKGNVRELRNCIEQMVILCEDHLITREDVPPRILSPERQGKKSVHASPNLHLATGDLEKQMIQDALIKCNYNKSAAARLLGIKRTTLYYKLKCHGLENLAPDPPSEYDLRR